MTQDQFFTILVSIPLKPGCAKEFLALLDDLFAAMHSEPTFVSATALQGADDPDTIVLCETWLDRNNFSSVQRNRPYRGAYEARLPDLLREPRRVDFFTVASNVSHISSSRPSPSSATSN
jgi:quinol monooxygenase YgiN